MILRSISYVAQGAERYVTGDVAPYNQRNEMFKHPFWDPQKEKLRGSILFQRNTAERQTGGSVDRHGTA